MKLNLNSCKSCISLVCKSKTLRDRHYHYNSQFADYGIFLLILNEQTVPRPPIRRIQALCKVCNYCVLN